MTDYAPNPDVSAPTDHAYSHAANAVALARLLRAASAKPAPEPQRWDRVVRSTLIMASGLAAAATLIAVAWIDLRPRTQVQPVETAVAGVALRIPANWLGPRSAGTGAQEVGIVRLRFSWPDLGPASAESRDIVHVTVQPLDKEHGAERQMSVWSRFLTPTVWSHPGGLVIRGFKTGSPFERDELYMTAPDGRDFAALCPLTLAAGREEPCRLTMRHGPFDLAVRLPRDALSHWEQVTQIIRARVEQIRG
jgi:hypothetical protein